MTIGRWGPRGPGRDRPARRGGPLRRWPALAPALVAVVAVAVPSAAAAFTASTTSTSSLTARSSFPDYPTAVGEAWDGSARSTARAATGLELYHRGEDGASAGAGGTAADSSGNGYPGAYAGATDGPSLWWPFDEGSGTDVTPRAGGVAGTVDGGGVTWATGTAARPTPSAAPAGDTALTFDRTSGHAVQGAGPALDTSEDFSVSAWVHVPARLPGGSMSAVSQDGTSITEFHLGMNSIGPRGQWTFSVPRTGAGNSAEDTVLLGVGSGELDTWVHLTAVFDTGANSIALHVTNTAGTTRSATLTRAPGSVRRFDRPSAGHPCAFVVGRDQYDGSTVDLWKGSIDDVRAFPRALTLGDVQRITADPHTSRWRFADVSAGRLTTTTDDVTARTATLSGAGSSSTTRTDDAGLTLDGTSAYAAAPSTVATASSFSVSTWVHLTSADAARTGTEALVSQDGANVPGFTLGRGTSGGTARFEFTMRSSDSTSATLDTVYSAFTPADRADRWTHLLGVFDATAQTTTLYVDGNAGKATSTGVRTAGSAWSATGDLQFGRRRASGSTYDGYAAGTLDTVSTFGWALSPGDAHDLFLSTPAAPRTPSPLGELAAGALGALDGPQRLAVQGSSTAVAFSGAAGAYNPRPFSSSPTGPFSLELWFQAPKGSGGTLIGFADDTTQQNSAKKDRMVYLDDHGHLQFAVYAGGARRIASPATYLDSRPHHLVATFGSVRGTCLYVDGVLVASDPTSTTAQDYGHDGYWRWGGSDLTNWADAPADHFFTGLLDEVAVYSRELPAQDVALHYYADH